MTSLVQFLSNGSFLNTILIVLATVGGFFAFRNGRQNNLSKFQDDTNKAQKDRIDVLEDRIKDMEKENIIQRHIIDTITLALEKEGMVISIAGDMVTIENVKTGVSRHRKRSTITTTQAATITKKEEV